MAVVFPSCCLTQVPLIHLISDTFFQEYTDLMQVGMRVDLELEDGSKACGVFIHKKLSDSAGYLSGC